MESIDDVLDKRYSSSLVKFMKLVDPEKKFAITKELATTWDRLPVVDQRKLYMYLLYRKWRGIAPYGTPYDIITGCHPAPFNWNNHGLINFLIQTNRAVIARYQGSYGTYTWDEARLYGMTDIKPYKLQTT